ncbi:hypothetical protein [Hydrogenophaga flava]|uniref:hypothetical protein n=1 Tax=Hydrogenophaga flava TaxID=65657 RepID=UPI00082611A2|nr:hypothetical protein [Hydrogenophaga flava]
MNTPDHQRHAAQCRHKLTTAAKERYHTELCCRFSASPKMLATDLRRFVGSERQRVAAATTQLNSVHGLDLKESTLRTWLRQWYRAQPATKATVWPRYAGFAAPIQVLLVETPVADAMVAQARC